MSSVKKMKAAVKPLPMKEIMEFFGRFDGDKRILPTVTLKNPEAFSGAGFSVPLRAIHQH
jgi:hypothetical protein